MKKDVKEQTEKKLRRLRITSMRVFTRRRFQKVVYSKYPLVLNFEVIISHVTVSYGFR